MEVEGVVLALDGAVDEVHGRAADEAGDEHVRRIVVDGERLVDLHDVAPVHDADAIAHGHGFDLVVGDIDHGRGETGVELGDFGSSGYAHFGVEI